MDMERRRFIRRSLVVLGAVGGGAALTRLCGAQGGSAPAAPAGAAASEPACPACAASASAPALTTDGRVVHMENGVMTEHHHHRLGVNDPQARQGEPNRKWVMVIDLASCDGCGTCTVACSKMHFVPPDRQWIKVLRMQDAAETAPYFFPQPCYHCDNPPCTKVCPVDATFKREDGVVLIDNERCIGCRFCMAACPYGARSFNWGHPHDPPEALAQTYSPEEGYPRRVGTVEKCDFCPDMAREGKLPGCAGTCPMGAIYYGDENEDAVTNSRGDTVRFSQLMVDRAGYRHMEELGTKPRVYYLPPKFRSFRFQPPLPLPTIVPNMKKAL